MKTAFGTSSIGSPDGSVEVKSCLYISTNDAFLDMEFYAESCPLKGCQYFASPFWSRAQSIGAAYRSHNAQRASISAVVCFYNEEGYMLENTVRSMAEQKNLDDEGGLDVLVVGDGLDHLTPSMKMQLKRMFGNRCPVEKTDWPDDGANICVINTYSTPVDGSSSASDESGNGSGTVAIRRLSLVLKRRNLRKMNSHEWLFRAFAIGSTYAFTTDCATLLHPDCLATFCRHFEQHPTCVAATGRKLTQTAAQQADKHDTEAAKDSWSESVLRQTQAYMFETEGNSVLAATDAFWVLNPLHGPCSFFHYPRMASGRLLEHYFNIAYSKSSETGLLMGNVRLGEDALLAALSLFQVASSRATSSYVEGAKYYFDVELTLERLVHQRRRWFNANLATPIYLLFGAGSSHPKMLWDSAQSTWKKLASTCMLLLIIFANISSKMLTSVYAAVFYHSNQLLWTPILGEARAGLIANTAVLVYLTIYILFVSVHVKRVGKEDTKFCEPLWVAAYVTGAIGSFLALAALPLFFVRAFLLEVDASSQAVAFTILFLTYGTFLLPLIRSAYMCPRTFLNALHPRVFICWTLSAPTLIGLLHSFALARVADLTWGNRPGGEGMVPMHPDTRRQKHACYCSESGCNEEPLHGSNICREHAWLSQQARKLHGINAIVVAANVTMALTMSYLGTALPSLRSLMYQMLVLFSIVLFIPLLFTEVLALIHDMWAALRWISCAALQCIWCLPCNHNQDSGSRNLTATNGQPRTGNGV